jgi:hypothetical protein
MLNRGESLCEQYEALRAQATGECPGIATPRGLALLLRRGMPGWMTAWLDCVPVTRTTAPMSTDDKGNRLLNSLHSEVAILLASMALHAQKEVQLC